MRKLTYLTLAVLLLTVRPSFADNAAAPGGFAPSAVVTNLSVVPATVTPGESVAVTVKVSNNNAAASASTSISSTVTATFTNPALSIPQTSDSNPVTLTETDGADITAHNVTVPLILPTWLAYAHSYQAGLQAHPAVVGLPTIANGLQTFTLDLGDIAPGASSAFTLYFIANSP